MINQLIHRVGPGGSIELLTGTYEITNPINITAGGHEGRPVTIRGQAGGAVPQFIGSRSEPYDPAGEPGRPIFRLESGANHLRFDRLACARAGNGCFMVAAPIVDLAITNVTATNVRRFFENAAADGGPNATIAGLHIANVTINGFSKGAIRLGYDSHDVVLVDIYGDSLGQDGDNFAIGVHLTDTVHDVVLQRVTMNNARDTLHEYWNGDGFAAESDTYDLTFVDTVASGNTDAGYDLKASGVQLTNVLASDNKRNFRFWGAGIVLEQCRGIDPNLRGGTGTQAQVHIAAGGSVQLSNCTFVDHDHDTIVFQLEGDAHLIVRNTTVERSVSSDLSVVEPEAYIDLLGVVEHTS
jgi:hypothetical protein